MRYVIISDLHLNYYQDSTSIHLEWLLDKILSVYGGRLVILGDMFEGIELAHNMGLREIKQFHRKSFNLLSKMKHLILIRGNHDLYLMDEYYSLLASSKGSPKSINIANSISMSGNLLIHGHQLDPFSKLDISHSRKAALIYDLLIEHTSSKLIKKIDELYGDTINKYASHHIPKPYTKLIMGHTHRQFTSKTYKNTGCLLQNSIDHITINNKTSIIYNPIKTHHLI